MDRPPAAPEYDEPTLLAAMTALHGARKTPADLRPKLVTHLLDAGLVAYTDIGWTLTAAGYRKLATAEGTYEGHAYARTLDEHAARLHAAKYPKEAA